jgi:hypothetical protein
MGELTTQRQYLGNYDEDIAERILYDVKNEDKFYLAKKGETIRG